MLTTWPPEARARGPILVATDLCVRFLYSVIQGQFLDRSIAKSMEIRANFRDTGKSRHCVYKFRATFTWRVSVELFYINQSSA